MPQASIRHRDARARAGGSSCPPRPPGSSQSISCTGIAQCIPDGDGDHLTVADLDGERIYRKPVLGGLINEYSRAA
jgi:hypothetical protein